LVCFIYFLDRPNVFVPDKEKKRKGLIIIEHVYEQVLEIPLVQEVGASRAQRN